MRTLIIITTVLSISCLAVASGVYISLNAKVEDIEERLEREQGRAQAEVAAPPAEVTPEWATLLEARLSTLEERIESLQQKGMERGESNPAFAPSLPGSAMLPSADTGASSGEEVGETSGGEPSSPEGRASLEKKMKDLESKLGEVQKRLEEGKEEKKPKFDQFAARLGLDDYQKEATREILLRGKGEFLECLQRPLPDGTVMIDEIAEAYFQGSPDPKEAGKRMQRVFVRLFKEKVPGTEKTFVEAIGEMNTRIVGEMKEVMTEEQVQKYDEWAPDPTDIEVPNCPISKYMMKYMERLGEETEGENGR